MTHELYIFGSITRGEVSSNSDVDILVLPNSTVETDAYPPSWSVYSRDTIKSYYEEGRLFAWHLHLEAKCIYSKNDRSWLETLGAPAPYSTAAQDIDSLADLFEEALSAIRNGTPSLIYEVGIAYTAIRDIAMSASWNSKQQPIFSRRAPYLLNQVCPLPESTYNAAMAARHCSTRGGVSPSDIETLAQELCVTPIRQWINDLRQSI